MSSKGKLVIMSAPSGTGKSTVCKYLLEEFDSLSFSISYTTRKPRDKEVHGVHYFFTDKEDFQKKIEEGFWLEWAEVHGNYYGTSLSYIKSEIEKGKSILLDIDVEGARQILEKHPDSLSIFLMPPDIKELRSRLIKRGTDPIETIEKRIKNSEKEIAQVNMYKYCVINDDLTKAVNELKDIFKKEIVNAG